MAHMNIEFFSNCLRRPVSFKLLIPNDFNDDWQSPQKRAGQPMKSLFLLHGYTGAAGNWVPERLATLYNFAIVMPNGENGFWVDGLATGHRYGAFLGEELPGYIERTFRLSMRTEDTFIMGLSMGGFGALHAALAYPERFGKVAALSSALIIHDKARIQPGFEDGFANYEYYRQCFGDLDGVETSRANPEVLVDELLSAGRALPEIFMACGTEDFLLENNRRFHRFLEERGVKHQYFESPGSHNDEFWAEYAVKMVELMFGE